MEGPVRLRKPSQARTQERVGRALAAAERLILERGPEEVSIPDVAEASGVPRASLYQFYANKHQLFADIAEQHLSRVALELKNYGAALAGYHWRDVVPLMMRAASHYYNENPVAGILILGWPMSRATYLAQEVTIENIGDEVRTMFLTLSPPVSLSRTPDVATLLVELGFACMKYGYYRDGHISEDVMQQATLAVTGYLEQVLPPAVVASRPGRHSADD